MVNIDLSEPAELIKKGLVKCREKQKNHPFGIFHGQNPLQFSFPLVLLQISTLIGVTRIPRFLLKPLRQPKVVSEILVMGFMYFLFLSGVKMVIMVIRRAGKKHWYIALVGVLEQLCCSVSIALIERKSLDKEIAKASSIWGISSCSAIAAFPVLYPIVRELNLLSSEIARMALSTAVVSDVIGMNALLIFEALKQGEHRAITALWYVISSTIIVVTIIGGVRQAMIWIVRTTREGKPVDQIYVITILLGVMVAGLIADMFGLTIVNGPLWLGLAVPDGPPLGAILVEKSETIVRNILMPFSFMYIGIIIDVSSMSCPWSHLQPLLFMVLAAYMIKMVSTLVDSRFFDTMMRDSLTLSLIMSLKGEVEILLFLHMIDIKIIGKPHFTVMVLSTASVTALATPLISILYDPTRPNMVNKRRNIRHTPPNTELHIVACIHGEENLSGLLKLLEVSNPTVNSPLSVYALGLVELVGRSNPILIDHENEEKGSDQSNFSSIHKALKNFHEARGECMKICSYTTITSKKSMYQDICGLALSKKAFFQSVNSNVLAHAPCSVGILVDKNAREALTYADRMDENPFLSHDNVGDSEMDKKLDDGLVAWFWVKSEGNNRIVYREVVVKNGEETIAAIQAMNKECYDLWIVGRKHGINPVLLKGLSNWSDNNELGVIGDYAASVDFDSKASVLAVQQQILRGQEKASASLLGGFSFCTWKQ
ncbi:hypothetical protein Pfo_006948 [Paulownia fortunei]|nr:hypothetical protein Pfo_006948 [Paulownia fortunei]